MAYSVKRLPASLDHLIGAQSFWQATKHEHYASPVGNALVCAENSDPDVLVMQTTN
jgi:hypothetical protein